jgi:parallel beta-helix repeat protein
MKVISAGVVVSLFFAAAGLASAADDVKPIGVPKEFPITIDAPGTYRLTSNLKVPSANTTAIQITADNVTLDLNGFSIVGPTVCLGSPLTCKPTGSGQGILASKDAVTVLNGTVRGMGNDGIALIGKSGRVEKVHVASNGGNGISALGACTLSGNTARSNGAFGILVLGSSTVSDNTAEKNGRAGIQCVLNCKLSDNTSDSTLVPEKPVGETSNP